MTVESTFLCIFFFFFQAEDGIRDLTVTGVQTCALPISQGRSKPTTSTSGNTRLLSRARAPFRAAPELLVTQFAVYRNPSPQTRADYPFLLDVQSVLFEDLQTRVVIPLTRAPALTKYPLAYLTPALRVDGETYLLMTPQLDRKSTRLNSSH